MQAMGGVDKVGMDGGTGYLRLALGRSGRYGWLRGVGELGWSGGCSCRSAALEGGRP